MNSRHMTQSGHFDYIPPRLLRAQWHRAPFHQPGSNESTGQTCRLLWHWITHTHPLKHTHMHTNTDIRLRQYKTAVECAAFVYIVAVQHMCVFMNVPVCVCAPRQASLSLHPGCGLAWGSHRGVFINEKPPAPPCPCLLTASCHNHQMPPNTQIHRLPPPPTPPVPGCGGSQCGIISHRGGAMLLRPLL